MEEILKIEKNDSSWIRFIKKKINLNKNFIGIFLNPKNILDDYSFLSFGKFLNPKFSEKHVCITFLDFLEKNSQKFFRRGDVVFLDLKSFDKFENERIQEKLFIVQNIFRCQNLILFISCHQNQLNHKNYLLSDGTFTLIEKKCREYYLKPKILLKEIGCTTTSITETPLKKIELNEYGFKKLIPIYTLCVPEADENLINFYKMVFQKQLLEFETHLKESRIEKLDKLTPQRMKERLKIYHYFQNGLSIPEIAKMTGRKERNIYYHLQMIKKEQNKKDF
jgi:hypothetical protein